MYYVYMCTFVCTHVHMYTCLWGMLASYVRTLLPVASYASWSYIASMMVCIAHGIRKMQSYRHATTRHGDTTRHETTRYNTTRYDTSNTIRHDIYDTTRHNTTQHNTTRHDTTRYIRHDTTEVIGSLAAHTSVFWWQEARATPWRTMMAG